MHSENQGPGLSPGHVLSVEKGGTGTSDRNEAISSLHAIPKEKLGVVGGVANFRPNTTLIPSSMIPPTVGLASIVNVEGPTEGFLNETLTLKITNYDSFTAYTVNATGCQATRVGDTITVVLNQAVPRAMLEINGTDFPILLLVPDAIFPPGQTSRSVSAGSEVLAASHSGEFLMVGAPAKASSRGELTIFTATQNAINQLLQILPTDQTVSIAYSGEGVKRFITSQGTQEFTGSGTATFTGRDSITIEGRGAVVQVNPSPQEGLPEYPEGLPVYQPAVYQWMANAVTQDTNDNSPTKGQTFSMRLTASGWDNAGILTNPKLHINNGGPETAVTSVTDFIYGEDPMWEGTALNEPAAYLSPHLSSTFNLERQMVTPQQGLPEHPQGLPPYKPATAGGTEYRQVTFTSNYFGTFVGHTVDQVVLPYDNYRLGGSMAVANNGSYAYTLEGMSSGGHTRIPRVRVNIRVGAAYIQRTIYHPNPLPLSKYGTGLAISQDGSTVFVGDSADDTVRMYRWNATTQVMDLLQTLQGPAGSGFGSRLVISGNGELLGVALPNTGNFGEIHLYGFDSNRATLLSTVSPSGLSVNSKITTLFKVVSLEQIIASNGLTGTNRRVLDLRNTGANWTTHTTFTIHGGGSMTGFADSISVDAAGTALLIGITGSGTERGSVEAWVRFQDVWTYMKTYLKPSGQLGDGYGKQVHIAKNRKHVTVLGVTTPQTLVSYS